MRETQEKKTIPEGFTTAMAVMDCLPVLFFSVMVSVISLRFHSMLFFVGAFLVILAGALKCLWKFVVALVRKNVPILFYQMRVLMPLGFILIILALIIDRNKISVDQVFAQIKSFPACICYGIGVMGMICMSIFAKKLDSTNAKHNWIEQGTNAAAQFFFMLGVLL